jgi:mRNA interferase RelE/StbE
MNGRFDVRFYDKAVEKEYRSLDGSAKRLVDVGLAKLRVRADEIGKPLHGDLKACKELKFRGIGIRVVFRILEDRAEIVEVLAIGPRDKGEAFTVAAHRLSC